MNALEGKRANPRSKPPFPAMKGLWGGPTIVNNVETLANLPAIIRHGPAWFKGLARNPEGAGTKLFCVSGHVREPVCVELPLGTTLREVIDGPCGGMRPGSTFKACLPGGASTPYFTAAHLDVPLDFDPVARAGSRLGTGGIVVFDQDTCLVAATPQPGHLLRPGIVRLVHPLPGGAPFVRQLLTEIEEGQGTEEHLAILREHVHLLNYAFCALAPGAMGPVEGLLRHFEEELREHLILRRCPFGKSPCPA